MSVRSSGSQDGHSLSRTSLYMAHEEPTGFPAPAWTRPSDWPALDPVVYGTQKVQCLVAVSPQPQSTYLYIRCDQNWTIDWGDGVVENANTNTKLAHIYDYNNVNLGPVTTEGFKTAIVTITPQAGSVLTVVSLFEIHPDFPRFTIGTGPIIEVHLNCPNLAYFLNSESYNRSTGGRIQHFVWGQGYSGDTYFRDMVNLVQIDFPFNINVYNDKKVFDNCPSLKDISGEITLGKLGEQFRGCKSLTRVPNIKVTGNEVDHQSGFFNANLDEVLTWPQKQPKGNYNSMFNGCKNLRSFPATVDLSLVTSFGQTFQSTSLRKFLNSNLSSCVTTYYMFYFCENLDYVTDLNMPALTQVTSMFSDAKALQTAPNITMANALDMSGMFLNCTSLRHVPNYNTPLATNMSNMFSSCESLVTAPLLTTANVTNMGSMFYRCKVLISIPAYDCDKVTSFGGFLSECWSLSQVDLYNVNATFAFPNAQMSQNAFVSFFEGLKPRTSTLTVTLGTNPGATTAYTKTATSTAGSTTLTLADTTNIAVGMCVTGTNIMSGVACSTDTAGDLITATTHGLVDGTRVSFAATNVGGVARKAYYVINATTDTFQCSATAGGSAVTVTTTGATTMFYPRYVTAIVANTSVTLSAPASSSGSSSVIFRALDTSLALIKGWTTIG